MPSKNSDSHASLSSIVAEFKSRSLFTDVYLEAGNLLEEEPGIQLEDYSSGGPLIFDLASLTKPLVTAPLTSEHLIRRGLNSLAPLSNWGEDLKKLPEDLIKLKPSELLAHQAGLPAWRNFWVNRLGIIPTNELSIGAHEHIEGVFRRHDKWVNPSQAKLYSDVGFILLSYALEKSSGQTFDELWQTWIGKLGLVKNVDLTFNPLRFSTPEKFASTGFCQIRMRTLRGEVHDENCAALGGATGHAGLFGTGRSVTRYLRALAQLKRAEWNRPYFSSGSDINGLQPGDDGFLAEFLGGKSVGHWGFTGTGFWVHPATLNFIVLLTNRTINFRLTPLIREFRERVFQRVNLLF